MAVHDVTIQSNESWTLFVIKVSEVMGCSHNTMPLLGYIPSWKPARGKPVPKILDGLETLAKLIKECHDYIIEQKSKNKGKGVVKAWNIQLMDLFKAEIDSGKVRSFIVVLAWKVLTGPNDRAQQRLKLQPPFLNPLTPQRHVSTSS